MKHRWLASFTAWCVFGVLVLTISAADPGISLIGTGYVPGNASDLSGLDGLPICQRDDLTVCIDQATLGGFGSALAST
jgi:hypothetical protein